MSGQDTASHTDLSKPEVYVSGSKLPYTSQYLYRVAIEGRETLEINSTRKWTAQEILDVQSYYRESLTGYVLGGEPLVGWTPPTNPTPRPPIFRNRRRAIKAVEE